MKSKLIRVAVMLGVVGLAGVAAWWYANEEPAAPADLVLYGNVDIRQVELAFKTSERIERLLVQEGDPVRQGQVLARLETRRLDQAVAQQEAQVAAQQQIVARLEAGSRPEEIRKARAEAAAAKVEARNAQRSYERLAALVEKQFISPQQADDARAAAEAAEARQKAAEAALRLVEIGPRKEDIAAAKNTLKALEAGLAQARQELADAVLTAPADGVIRDRILEPGDMASPQRPVYTLALTEPVWVRAYVDAPDLGKLKPGMTAWVTTDTFPGKRYRAWIGYISPTAEFTPKSVQTAEVRASLVYQVRALVCNPENELRLGMPATVTIPLGREVQPGRGADPCQQP